MMINQLDLAYIAGLLDGEGSIVISNSKQNKTSKHLQYKLQLTIANTHLETLEWVKTFWGFGSIIKNGGTKQRQVYSWQTSAYGAERVLCALLPYLKIKKLQTNLALEFRKTSRKRGQSFTDNLERDKYNAKRQIYRKKLQALNHGVEYTSV